MIGYFATGYTKYLVTLTKIPVFPHAPPYKEKLVI